MIEKKILSEEEKLIAEQEEANILINEGFIFETPKRSFLKHFGSKTRKWHVRPVYFGTMFETNKHAVDIKINLSDESISSILGQLTPNIIPLVSYVAVGILNSKIKIFLFKKLLTNYLLWRLRPEETLKIVMVIIKMMDLKNFISSIRLIGTMTSPNETTPIDGKQQVSSQFMEQ